MDDSDFADIKSRFEKIIEEEIIDPAMKRGTERLFNFTREQFKQFKGNRKEFKSGLGQNKTFNNFSRTGDVSHTEGIKNTPKHNAEQSAMPEETTTADENQGLKTEMATRKAFKPLHVSPAVDIFTPLPPLPRGGFKLSSGEKTQDFVPVVARSNASYLKWINRFNAVPAGSAIGRVSPKKDFRDPKKDSKDAEKDAENPEN